MSISAVFDARFCQEKYPPPCVFVLFGATGNLAEKKIFPALEALRKRRLFHPQSCIVAVSRRSISSRELAAKANISPELAATLSTVKFDPENDTSARILADCLKKFDSSMGRIFYLAVPPSAFRNILLLSGRAKLFDEHGNFCNVVMEKPPGYTLEDVRNIYALLSCFLKKHQIYLIDHYLGKDEVQNILTLRFANRIFSGVWNCRNIESITIAVNELNTVGTRAGYFDRAGIVRDMFQSHLLIMLGLCIMRRPAKFDAQHINSMLAGALKNISVRKVNFAGQYQGYLQTEQVSENSLTPTCADISFFNTSQRQKRSVFRLCAGKAMSSQRSFINVKFRSGVFPFSGRGMPSAIPGNEIELELKPFPGIKTVLCAKKNGPHLCFGTLMLSHTQKEHPATDGYQRLLIDCQNCDRTFFPDISVFEETGRICDAAEELISSKGMAIYSPGTLEFST